MKISLLAVCSLDGFITRGNESNIYNWTSAEDTAYFKNKIKKARLIFMGAKTYGTVRNFLEHKKSRTRVVFTRNPHKFKKDKIPNVLEFTSNSPKKVANIYNRKGISEALLVGGSEINSLFLKSNLVNEILITVEPLLFGEGKKLINSSLEKKLKLISIKKLNKKGTILIKYKVVS